mmetsp:Transcript_22411/g.66440  ORF Transcript_22411/g.66440 Transcript_22411/m.66440 type:complete len:268 (+) Transcript_22411:101-904(+)
MRIQPCADKAWTRPGPICAKTRRAAAALHRQRNSWEEGVKQPPAAPAPPGGGQNQTLRHWQKSSRPGPHRNTAVGKLCSSGSCLHPDGDYCGIEKAGADLLQAFLQYRSIPFRRRLHHRAWQGAPQVHECLGRTRETTSASRPCLGKCQILCYYHPCLVRHYPPWLSACLHFLRPNQRYYLQCHEKRMQKHTFSRQRHHRNSGALLIDCSGTSTSPALLLLQSYCLFPSAVFDARRLGHRSVPSRRCRRPGANSPERKCQDRNWRRG